MACQLTNLSLFQIMDKQMTAILITTETNLRYDSNDAHCSITTSHAHGQPYAFIQCLDIGSHGKSRRIKRYWGRYDPNNAEESIKKIMMNGGYWPDLPK